MDRQSMVQINKPINKNYIRYPLFGDVWKTKNSVKNKCNTTIKSAKFQNRNNSNPNCNVQHFNKKKPNKYPSLDSLIEKNIEHSPTSIYFHNDRKFLQSLRNFDDKNRLKHNVITTTATTKTSLARYVKMSREIVDNFVRLKTDEYEQQLKHDDHDHSQLLQQQSDNLNPVQNNQSMTSNNDNNTVRHYRKNSAITKTKRCLIRPKSATSSSRRNKHISNGVSSLSKSNTKLNSNDNDDNDEHYYSDDEDVRKHRNDSDDNDIDDLIKPLFHRSMDRISSIANWERQIRYEFEIEKELQKREFERQRDKLQNDQRKLEDWDKQLRIELDARERKLRLGEEELKSRVEDFNKKTNDLIRREQMINEIVSERIKNEMKFEIEKLRKKFNELEIDKNNLIKKEERVKEVEARLHEQVKIVKEKIDGKRMSDMELAKCRKELEITKKENEVLKEKVDSMEDYQITKFENRAFKNELQILKESLESKNLELERNRERWEKEQRSNDQKMLAMKKDLRKTEQELVLLKQKYQADHEELTSKYEASNGQVKRLKAFIKDHLAKLNNDFSSTTQTLNQFRHSVSFGGAPGNSSNIHQHQISHHRGHSLYHVPSSSSSNTLNQHRSSSYHHQRSISMDGFHKSSSLNRHYTNVRGCRLCNDNNNNSGSINNITASDIEYGIFHRNNDLHIHENDYGEDAPEEIVEEDEAEMNDRLSALNIEPNNSFEKQQHEQTLYKSFETKDNDEIMNNQTSSTSDEFVRKIVDKIYEKMSNPNNNKISDISPVKNDREEIEQNNHNNQFENSFDELNSSHHHQQRSAHRSLYEELLLASELNDTSSLSKHRNKLNESNHKTFHSSSPMKKFTNSQNNIKDSSIIKNDTNNNRINGSVVGDNTELLKNEPKMDSNKHNGIILSVGENIDNANNLLNDHLSNHSTKSSESFEADW